VTPAFFENHGDHYTPLEITRSPWDPRMVHGAAVGGLLAHLLDKSVDHEALGIARLTIDILGQVPQQRLSGRVFVVRDGRQMQVVCAELLTGTRVVARATALRVRKSPTPAAPPMLQFPAPHEVPLRPFTSDRPLLNHTRARPVQGMMHEPGPGTMWAAFDVEIVAGAVLSPLARAAILGDFGSGVGSVLCRSEWNFANIDISIHFLRLPVGEWVLVDAVTETEGNGYAIARCVFADQLGVYGRGFQTLFVAPVEASQKN
jgi:Acyl-CoA thioesterase C-terminal domain/Acyl-CoA thioesterase N-terminal domain